MGLRIILDKSVIYGLNNSEADLLDRYFFQIVPPILTNEILADLAKETTEPNIQNRISSNVYRISGNRGLTINYKDILVNSLLGNEILMEGKYLPAGERMVRAGDGSIGTIVETPLEDNNITRWERKNFTDVERWFATNWRRKVERVINPKIYTRKISEAGLEFKIPKSDNELAEIVDSLLRNKKFQGKLLVLLAKEHEIPFEYQKIVINRWFKEGKPMIKDFAPYALFCLRANFLWAIGLTNSNLFSPDKNDRKDLQYCYYLPHCEIFASKDKKHKRLVPFLLRPDQSFVDSSELKADLGRLSENWDTLSREERINYRSERGDAPPEDENSIVFRLWKKHRGKISRSLPLEIGKMKLVDSRLPKEEQVEITFEELVRSIAKKYKNAPSITSKEMDSLRNIHGENNPSTFLEKKTFISRERLLKLYPHLKDEDLNK